LCCSRIFTSRSTALALTFAGLSGCDRRVVGNAECDSTGKSERRDEINKFSFHFSILLRMGELHQLTIEQNFRKREKIRFSN
jgi:hypothetical protein